MIKQVKALHVAYVRLHWFGAATSAMLDKHTLS